MTLSINTTRHRHRDAASYKSTVLSLLAALFFVVIAGGISSTQPFVQGLKVRPPLHGHSRGPVRNGLLFPSPHPVPNVRRQAVRRRTKMRQTVDELRGGSGTARSFLQERPFVSAIVITTGKAIAADLMTQLVLTSGRAPWDARRTALFAAFGLLYQGCAQYAIVNWGWERLFPGTSTGAVVSKVCGMNLVSDPFLFLPAFYIFKQSFAERTLSWQVLRSAVTAYRANAWIDIRNSWMVWFPGHAVTYGVMPAHQRIPWMAFLSFFYMCILSLTRGGGS